LLAERAGLAARDVEHALASTHWREIAEGHRTDLAGHDLWGVPAFRVEGFPAVWGQDRLWMVEEDLITVLLRGTQPARGA
jgi:2-hydroxychromene-2-carboxylate isomerase